MEEKIDILASRIVNYSLNVKENERVLINTYIVDEYFIKRLIHYIIKNKGIPFIKINNDNINTYILENILDNRYKELTKQGNDDIENYDSFISIKYNLNDYNKQNIDSDALKKISQVLKKSDYIRINKRKWVLLNYPSPTDAHKANMSTEKYKEYALDAMIYNYEQMSKAIEPLKKLMEKTDKVRIIGVNTDIEFSIKGMPIIPCIGSANLPDGELYTAPIKNSVNGIITYNTPSPYQGHMFNNVSLVFKDGKIVSSNCIGDKKALEKILDTDEGAKYIGEFSFGLNPLITKPMGDILYDEKIIGSIHFTPGQAYQDAYNGNDSGIHWDMVLIQREEYGGGEVYFDHVLIRKNGKFVLPELLPLNYDI